ncbi:hypothetical protein ACFYSC_20685 [Streptosporangium sp. NPDC004379]|uniref:hypothetical protein n=1 Tax=Streptosporangium sp. NPDC004379 TaxID=3366189 RepID=UPI003685DD71
MVVFRFSSPGQLNAWLDSDVRRGLLEEGRAFLEERAARAETAGAEGVGPEGVRTDAVGQDAVRPDGLAGGG